MENSATTFTTSPHDLVFVSFLCVDKLSHVKERPVPQTLLVLQLQTKVALNLITYADLICAFT